MGMRMMLTGAQNIPRGKGIERDTRADNPFIDTVSRLMLDWGRVAFVCLQRCTDALGQRPNTS